MAERAQMVGTCAVPWSIVKRHNRSKNEGQSDKRQTGHAEWLQVFKATTVYVEVKRAAEDLGLWRVQRDEGS